MSGRLVAVRVVVAAIVLVTWSSARADVTRYALVIGNNVGDHDEVQLHYAERDADRMATVLMDLGGFAPGHVTVLHDVDADAARSALISLNDRIRTSGPGDTMLVVYFSGHADADALHLGSTSLGLPQLEELVRGSSATLRLLILDSCRSGTLTRVKGGKPGPVVPIVLADTLAADGVVFWTATAASEDAQESDDIKGSFFSHYLISGLSGPADVDGDGRVTISEAYEYARSSTLRASSRTFAGTQHPTFREEMRGRVDVALTTPAAMGRRGRLHAPDAREMLVLAGSRDGAVVAEVGAHDRTRWVSLRPARYFVRERTERYLLEGTVDVAAGEDHAVVDDELERLDYARLVRKGGRGRQDGVEAGFTIHTPMIEGGGPCAGVIAGYAIELPWLSVTPRVSACRETYRNSFVGETSDELAADVRVAHAWDVTRRLSVAGQVQVGGGVFYQHFETRGVAPARMVGALSFGVGCEAVVELSHGLSARLATEASTFVMRRDDDKPDQWETTLVLRAILALGVAF